MAGMPKQGYTNLVLAGWVPDPALGCGAPGVGWWPWGHPAGLLRDGGRQKRGGRKGKARLTQRRNLIRAELYSPAKDIGYFRDIGKK